MARCCVRAVCKYDHTMIRKCKRYVGVQTRFGRTNPLNERRVFFPILINGICVTAYFIILNFIIPTLFTEDYKPRILL